MTMMMIDLIVTRHPGLVEFLREKGMVGGDVAVVAHVSDPSILQGKVVAGVLPLNLAAKCRLVVEATLAIPAEKRGAELTRDEVAQYFKGFQAFEVVGRPIEG